MELLSLCKNCQSCVNNTCTDCYEPGILFACINYLEADHAGRKHTDNCGYVCDNIRA